MDYLLLDDDSVADDEPTRPVRKLEKIPEGSPGTRRPENKVKERLGGIFPPPRLPANFAAICSNRSKSVRPTTEQCAYLEPDFLC